MQSGQPGERLVVIRTYGRLELSECGSRWTMSGIEPHVAIRLKQLFPKIAKAATNNFRFPSDDTHCADLDWFVSRYPLEMSTGHAERLKAGRMSFEATQSELECILTPVFCPLAYAGLQPGQVIRQYQAQAIEVLRRRKGLLLGDDLGLGKTYSAAGFCLLPEAGPTAVVVQTHLQQQWAQKLGEFTTLRTHQIKGTKPYSLPAADVYIFRYSQLLGWVDFFATRFFKTVVFDEVQELRTGYRLGRSAVE